MLRLILMLALAVPLVGLAAKSPDALDKAAARASTEAEDRSGGKDVEEGIVAMPASPSDVVLQDPQSRKAYLESMQRYYAYRASGYDYRSRLFEWQLFSSRLIFWVVLSLVLVGVYFAWVQFHVALSLARAATNKKSAKPSRGDPAQHESARESASFLATELEVSEKGIAVKSSVLGVVVLALSPAFFYLYLTYVYPIKNVF